MPQKDAKGRDVRINVAANLLESKGAEKIPKATAYAFSTGGRLQARKTLDEKGATTLSLRVADVGSRVRVLIGPDIEEKELTVDDLLRRGAVEKSVRIDAQSLSPALEFQIIPGVWKCWLLGLCFVRGTLLKRTASGGVSLELPVCNAKVEVYEVDPIFILIPKLPDLEIERIRDFILNPPPLPDPPIDLPGPFPPFDGPVPVPGPDPAPDFRLSRNAQPVNRTAHAATTEAATSAQMITLAGATDLQFQARTASTPALRNVLINHAELVRPIFCRLFPALITKRLVATATTDECGHFQTFFFRGCLNHDTPDLYFKATQRLFGFFDVTVYEPKPVACYTHWNYVCGTEVTLITTHPLARTCPPCPPIIAPNNWVLVMAIGNHPLSRIRGAGQSLQGTTNATNIGLTDGEAPFGGLLRLRIEFDNSLRDDLDVKFYRVSWRKGTSGAFTPLTDECHRHYTHEVGGDLILEVLPLGPKVVGAAPNLFEIPPALPPLGQYSFPDLREDLTNAKFPTNTFAPPDQAGKYQLKVDLFDSAGALVNVAAKGIKYRVPTSTDLSGTIFTEDAAALGLVQDDDGDGLNSFLMTLHIDNNVCDASIAAPVLNGSIAADDCGVLKYFPSDSVAMGWTASHPNSFANYSFGVVRGAEPILGISGGANTGAPFSHTDTVANLLDADCTVAGFSENLYVAAMATNGWERLSGYDDSDVRAFVLAPQP